MQYLKPTKSPTSPTGKPWLIDEVLIDPLNPNNKVCIDVDADGGVWLDKDELKKLMEIDQVEAALVHVIDTAKRKLHGQLPGSVHQGPFGEVSGPFKGPFG